MAVGCETCAACGAVGQTHEHHLIPRSMGGADGPTVYLCLPCHGAVHGVTFVANLSDLVRAGHAKARINGTKSGRPYGKKPVDPQTIDEALKGLARGESPSDVAARLGISPSSVSKYSRRVMETDPARIQGILRAR